MSKIFNGIGRKKNANLRINCQINEAEIIEDANRSGESLRIKQMLKRAVEKDFAPQSLIDAIRKDIRR